MAPAFFADALSRCSPSARMLYKLPQDKWVAKRLAAQSSRTCCVFSGAPELRGCQCGCFAFQYAARAQALLQLFVYMSLLPAASLMNKAMVADFSASSLAPCQKQMIQRSVSRGSRETPQLFRPRGRDSVLDTVVGSLAFARIMNATGPRASNLRFRIGVAAPGVGESHIAPPSGAPVTVPLTCVTK